jgi:hypothetical protein
MGAALLERRVKGEIIVVEQGVFATNNWMKYGAGLFPTVMGL